MVSWAELVSRLKQFFRFSHQELQGIIAGVLVTGFIFSFRSWGVGSFDWLYGLKNLFLAIIAAGISFFGHIGPQKFYGLSVGLKVEFKTWWLGMLIALVLCFASLGNLTVVLAGGAWISFMVRHRLGEFRYGYKHNEQAIIGMWGVFGSLISAALFRIGNYYLPEVLFFERGLMISLVFALCSVLPLPSLEGLAIFFGSRGIYYVTVVVAVVGALLLLWGGGWGLLIGIILGLIVGGYSWLAVSSEK